MNLSSISTYFRVSATEMNVTAILTLLPASGCDRFNWLELSGSIDISCVQINFQVLDREQIGIIALSSVCFVAFTKIGSCYEMKASTSDSCASA
ncbi:UNVERIFIED_CONTAM: hypothetical protein Sindi_1156700 [Sesamum indicum]